MYLKGRALTELEKAMLYDRGEIRDKNGKIVKYNRELHVAPYPEIPDTVPCPDIQEAGKDKKQEKTIACNKHAPHPEYPEVVSPCPDLPDTGYSGRITKKEITKERTSFGGEAAGAVNLFGDLVHLNGKQFEWQDPETQKLQTMSYHAMEVKLPNEPTDLVRQFVYQNLVDYVSMGKSGNLYGLINHSIRNKYPKWKKENADLSSALAKEQYGNGRDRSAPKRSPKELAELKARLKELDRQNTECVVK